ncbi:hypothetical protein CSKR_109507 [Clonorchis sinensis]|uniref:Uncharacterized protein n=1 Tax=Clonorchis sinensis TaxID=79923 RepID=A0A3R7JN84_CLOSI|nr:hypothetical protein CSKR_109507 [Clonorchis sinensis]
MRGPGAAHSVAWKHQKREIQRGSGTLNCHASRRRHDGLDAARVFKPRQGKSKGSDSIRATDLSVTKSVNVADEIFLEFAGVRERFVSRGQNTHDQFRSAEGVERLRDVLVDIEGRTLHMFNVDTTNSHDTGSNATKVFVCENVEGLYQN